MFLFILDNERQKYYVFSYFQPYIKEYYIFL